jgi:hypothetical protein
MKKAFERIFFYLFVVLVAAFLGGTLIWLLWPIAIPAAFPGLVAAGTLAAKLGWWQAVCFSWLFSIIFAAVGSSAKSNN